MKERSNINLKAIPYGEFDIEIEDICKEQSMAQINVYYSDFRDCPGLKARFENFMRGPKPCLRIVRVCTNFLEVEGPQVLIRALYGVCVVLLLLAAGCTPLM